jgi:predicted transport protein
MPLFHISDHDQVSRITPGQFERERQLQRLVEAILLEVFGVRFVASEFVIRGEQPGRIDTLGLDLEGAPTIIEYKRADNENVINQGLYYMNWLLEHRGISSSRREALGQNVEISWSHPRLIIIAQNYAKWDTYAVNRMGEGIELWKYVLYGDDLLYLEMVYGQQRTIRQRHRVAGEEVLIAPEYTLEYHLDHKPESVKELFLALREGILGLAQEEGEIIETANKLYISYRHGKNFCEAQLMSRGVKLHLDIPHADLDDPKHISRDVSNVGHWGTGDVEVRANSVDEVEYVLDLIEQSYRLTL